MPRVKEKRKCKRCNRVFQYHNGNIKAKYCSRLCACRDRNTHAHQVKAGKAGGATKIKIRGSGNKTYVKEFGRHQHRVVMERILKRKLRKGEVVHHIDSNKKNNEPANLRLFKNQAEHARTHAHQKRVIPVSKSGN